MGRQQYLERLALGRSPFQDPVGSLNEPSENNHDLAASIPEVSHDEHDSTQAYDSKGRPINKRTEERNAAMRNAQNVVLALVGVVESKDTSDRIDEARSRIVRKQWEQLLEAEQKRGDDLNIVVEYLSRMLTWWPEALIGRVQAGLYLPSQSFADIILHDLRRVRQIGARACFAVFLPGAVPHLLSFITEALLCQGVLEVVGQLEMYLGRSAKGRRLPRWLRVSAQVANEILCAGVSALLMPLEFHAETQRLGLARSWPSVPHWRAFMPSGPLSSHRFLWTSPLSNPWLRFLGSPGLWLVLQRSLTRYQDVSAPIGAQFTAWEYPEANRTSEYNSAPEVYQDPLAWIYYHGYLLRYRALRWLGWTLEQKTQFPDNAFQNNTKSQFLSYNDDEHHGDINYAVITVGKYRSTCLSMQLARYLRERIDHLYQNLLILPLGSIAVRAVARSFMTTTLPKTSLALAAGPFAFSPVFGGPFGSLLSHGSDASSRSSVGSYLSKLGLSFALYCSTEVAISLFIYTVYRDQGIRNFGWKARAGQSDHIGNGEQEAAGEDGGT